MSQSEIESVLHETRTFEPSAEFSSRARIPDRATYDRLYAQSIQDPEGFWGPVARELPWIEPFDRVLP